MAVYLTEIAVDLALPPAQRPIPHQFAMGDNNAYTFTALLCDSRTPDMGLLTGTVSGELVRPDGETVALEGTKGSEVRVVTLDHGGQCNATPCSVTLPQACFSHPGRVTLTIKLTDGTTITQALSVSAVVVRTSTDVVVDPGEVVPDVAELQAIATEMTAAVAGAVRFDAAQTLTENQKQQARNNIGASSGGSSGEGAVRYDEQQSLTDLQKSQARYNINAASAGDIPTGVVRFDAAQSLTDTQKAQARSNITAASLITTGTTVTQAVQDGTTYDVQDARLSTIVSGDALWPAEAWGNGGSDTTAGVSVTSSKTSVTINGSKTSGTSFYNYTFTNGVRKVSGDDVRSANLVNANAVMKAGHAYRITMRVVSGTYTPGSNNSADFRMYTMPVGDSTVSAIRFVKGSSLAAGDEFSITRSYDTDTLLGLGMYLITGTGTFSTLVLAYTVEDVTGVCAGATYTTSSATPTLNAQRGFRYICSAAYVTSLSFTPSTAGICSVRFTSGTTPTVLTLPQTVKMPDWWSGVEASRTYEISIEDGIYGVVTSWA